MVGVHRQLRRGRAWSGWTAAAVSLALAVVGLIVAGPASATNVGTGDGNTSNGCALTWAASSVLNTDLRNDDPIYPGLMVDLDGTPTIYSNGGYITEVRPEINSGPGIFEINHWYDGAMPTGPLTAAAPTGVHWRIPIAVDYLANDLVLTVTLPEGAGFTVRSGQNIAAWGAPYDKYTWTNPVLTPTSPDGLTWTVPLGTLPIGSGVVVEFSGTVPAGTVLSKHAVADAQLAGTYAKGSATCLSDSGNNTDTCAVDWTTDATTTVADGRAPIPDVTRDEVVQPTFGDPGKFGIDGWSTVGATPGDATLFGRFVLATDVPMSDVTWVLHIDPAVTNPTFSVANPAPAWRVDGIYRTPVTIDGGVWDATAHTMTYRIADMPADSSVMISYNGAVVGGYVTAAAFTNTASLTATYAEGIASCLAAPTQTPTSTPTTPAPTSPPTPAAPSVPAAEATPLATPVATVAAMTPLLAETGVSDSTALVLLALVLAGLGVLLLVAGSTRRGGEHR